MSEGSAAGRRFGLRGAHLDLLDLSLGVSHFGERQGKQQARWTRKGKSRPAACYMSLQLPRWTMRLDFLGLHANA